MRHIVQALAVIFLLACYMWADVPCSPTTPIEQQSRTGMKHRTSGLQAVSLQQTSVEDILNWPNPKTVDRKSSSPIDNRETQAYTVAGDLWRVKVEDNDCDFHLEMTAPGNSRDADRIIVEIPQGTPFQQIRNTLIQALISAGEGDLSHKKSIDLKQPIPLQVSGYAFFDAFHYSHSNPKRGHGHGTAMVGTIWELHPVWRLQVLTSAPPAELVATAESEPETVPDPGEIFDFSVTKSFLQSLEGGRTIQPKLKVKLGHHSAIHPLESDCEMHVVGTPADSSLGSPNIVVIEPPNLCRIDPDGNESEETNAWLAVFDDLTGRTCDVVGFPRIFTEHATGTAAASNPNHVFEFHPALAIDCGDPKLSFSNFLKVYPGMRAISPSAATSCITDRTLEVRFDDTSQQYLFREKNGHCGNFAVIEVDGLNPRWVRTVAGGHTAVARVSTDGQTTLSLKLYTLAPSAADIWLAAAANPGARTMLDRKLVHGLFTYDYFSILKALHPKGQDWMRPHNWTTISFPIAFVIFGEAETAPWAEE